MNFVVVMLILGAVGAAALVVGRAARRRSEPRPLPDLPTPPFKVVALGNSGSGKTVLLASLFYQFRQTLGRPYYLRTDPEAEVRLNSLLATVIDPDEPWPGGTNRSATTSYLFDCVSQVDGKPTTVLKIEYVDYAGEILEHLTESNAALEDLFARIRRADALIGVLDGSQLLRFMNGNAKGKAYVIGKIGVMVRQLANAQCPIYLVISKWDILHGFGEPADADDNTRLSLVAEALMGVDHLRDLVSTRSNVRLIPVSSVGTRFATLEAGTGHVRKLSNGTFAPYNVEIPLAALIPDLFRRIESDLAHDTAAAIRGEFIARQRLTPDEVISEVGSFLLRPAGIALRASIDSIMNRPYGNEFVGLALDWIARPSRQKQAQLDAFRTDAQRAAYRLFDARMAVINDFNKQVQAFEMRLPASVVS
jgi:hypothetical protein